MEKNSLLWNLGLFLTLLILIIGIITGHLWISIVALASSLLIKKGEKLSQNKKSLSLKS